MDKYDIIVLVIASRTCNNINSITYDKLINNYWSNLIKFAKQNNYPIKFFLIFGNNVNTKDLNIETDDILILNSHEEIKPGILNKTIAAFEYININYKYKLYL